VFLDSHHHAGDPDDLAFAVVCGDALLERAVRDGGATYWRFVEHRRDAALLDPGVGWMQGAAGIAAYLFHLHRVLEQGRDSVAVDRLDTWFASGAAR
jgi:hypothetical protein